MKKISEKFRGIIIPIVTPLTKAERLDEDAFKRLLERAVSSGVHGIFICGSMGEYPALVDEEKLNVIEKACHFVDGKTVLMANISDSSEKRVIQNIKRIEKLPIDCYVATCPFYFIYSQKELEVFFHNIADYCNKPILLYDIPDFVNQKLTPELVHSLINHPNILGIKDSSGNFSDLNQLLLRRNSNSLIYQGSTEMSYTSLVLGCDGLIPGLANLLPKTFVQLYQLVQNKEFLEAKRLQLLINKINQKIVQINWMSATKYALSILDLCSPFVTAPFQELNKDQKSAVQKILSENKIDN